MSHLYKDVIKRQVTCSQQDVRVPKATLIAEIDEVYRNSEKYSGYKAHMEKYIVGEINEEELVSDLKSDYFESEETL